MKRIRSGRCKPSLSDTRACATASLHTPIFLFRGVMGLDISNVDEMCDYFSSMSQAVQQYNDTIYEIAHTYTYTEMVNFIHEMTKRNEKSPWFASVICELCNMAGEWCEAHGAPLTDFYGLLQGDEVYGGGGVSGIYLGMGDCLG